MTTKRFFKLQLIIILMLTFTLVCHTFSWSSRPAVKGGAFMSDAPWTAMRLETPKYYINGNECTAKTYQGVMNENGSISYQEQVYTVKVKDFGPDGILYFKTIIDNNKPKISTNTSIFIDIEYKGDSIQTKINVGVTNPVTKSSVINDEKLSSNVFGANFYPVLTGIEVTNSSKVIEWSIFNGSNYATATELTIKNIYVTNN